MKKTQMIQLTREQVEDAMASFLERMEVDWPDADQRHNVLVEKCQTLDRQFLRDDILPRIENHDEVAWLRANEVRLTVKSSVRQFVDQRIIRIQLLDGEAYRRFEWWRSH